MKIEIRNERGERCLYITVREWIERFRMTGLSSTIVNGLQHCAQIHALKESRVHFDLLPGPDTTSVCRGMGVIGARAEAAWSMPLAASHQKPSARCVPAPLNDLTLLGITPCRRFNWWCAGTGIPPTATSGVRFVHSYSTRCLGLLPWLYTSCNSDVHNFTTTVSSLGVDSSS